MFTQMPGDAEGFSFGSSTFGKSKPTKKPLQGQAFFAKGDCAVRELSFKGHEAEIKKLQYQDDVVVLFYASGGKSCPKACHEIRRHYKDFATATRQQLSTVAVQCTHRRETCAAYADKFPAVVLFSKGTQEPQVLSESKAVSGRDLERLLDKALSKTKAMRGVVELTRKHFASNGDPCNGQFCLLLMEHSSTTSSARDALKEAAKILKNEPVQVFYVQESKHPDFVSAFSISVASGLRGKRPATEALIYRPRRQTYEVFGGNVHDARHCQSLR